MTKPRALAVIILALFSVALMGAFPGCSKEPPWKRHKFTTIDRSRTSNQVELPRSLWEKLEGLIRPPKSAAGEKVPAPPKKPEVGPKGSLPTEFAPIKAYLIEKTKGILKRGNSEIVYGAGGGELNLSDFVEDRSGSFYFLVEFMAGVEGVAPRVFFLSNSLIRKKGGETVGTGCNTYFDVSSAFQKAVSGEGLLVSTVDGRHVSALAGAYFFAAVHEGKLHLASLIVKDTSHPELLCPR